VRYTRRTAHSDREHEAQREDAAHEGLRVVLDPDLCQAHGVCVSEAPEVFALAKGDAQVRMLMDDIPEELAHKVRTAARYCPTRALSIEE
jgi:ferredoxin